VRTLAAALSLTGALLLAAAAPARSASGPLYVSPSGSDVGACTKAAPCRSLQRAYARAHGGQTVLVEAGSYPEETLQANNPRLTRARPVVFRPARGRVVVAYIDLEGAGNVTFRRMQFGRGRVEGHAWYQINSKNTLCDRCVIRGQLAIDGGDRDGRTGTRNASFTNGSVGGYVANNADPQIGGMRGPKFLKQWQPTGVSFVNETFHDIDASSPAAHTECLQVLAVHGLTIRHSRFYGCNAHGNESKNSITFAGYGTRGTNDDYWDVTLADDMFTGGPAGSNQIALSWDDQGGFERDCRRITVRNSTILGTVLWGCPQAAATVVENTILTFQWTGAWAMNQCHARFRIMIWQSAEHCPGTGVRAGHQLSFVNATNTAALDLHLKRGSYGYGMGIGVR